MFELTVIIGVIVTLPGGAEQFRPRLTQPQQGIFASQAECESKGRERVAAHDPNANRVLRTETRFECNPAN